MEWFEQGQAGLRPVKMKVFKRLVCRPREGSDLHAGALNTMLNVGSCFSNHVLKLAMLDNNYLI